MKKVFLFFSIIFLLASCQKEDTAYQPITEIKAAVITISVDEAKTVFNKESENSKIKLTPDWQTFKTEPHQWEQRANVKAILDEKPNLNARLFFFTEGKVLKYNILLHESDEKGSLTIIYNSKGVSLRAFTVDKQGKTVYFVKKKTDKHSRYFWSRSTHRGDFGENPKNNPFCADCHKRYVDVLDFSPNTEVGDYDIDYHLDPVEVYGPKPYPKNNNPWGNSLENKDQDDYGYGAGYYPLGFDRDQLGERVVEPNEREKSSKPEEYITYQDNVPICVKKLIMSIGREKSNGQLIPYINQSNRIGTYIVNLFEKSSEIHIDFVVQNLGYGYINATTRTVEKRRKYGIVISHDLLERGSELFIAKTLIHEMIHAYFKMELQRDGLEEGMGDFVSDFAKILEDQGYQAEHAMMTKYVEVLAESLAAYDNNKHELSYYRSLAWTGLEGTKEYQKLSDEEKTQIAKIGEYEREANPNNLCH